MYNKYKSSFENTLGVKIFENYYQQTNVQFYAADNKNEF